MTPSFYAGDAPRSAGTGDTRAEDDVDESADRGPDGGQPDAAE